MEIRVLGPVQVRGDEVTTTVGPSLSPLLCGLAAARGRAVSVDRLVELLWPGEDTARRRATLRSHVSHLRKLLRQTSHGSEVADITRIELAVGRSAYALRLGDASLDLDKFEEQVRAARAAHDAGRFEAACEFADVALDLWRGDPLQPIEDDATGRVVIEDLHRTRREAELIRARAHIGQGKAHLAVAPLSRLLKEEPRQDLVRELLILALYVAGQQEEAAAECRTVIKERTNRGLDVAHLRSLQEGILKGNLDVAAGLVFGRSGPWQLPTPVAAFTGRAREVERIASALRRQGRLGAPHVAAIHGPPGIGKSALALHLAHMILDRFDGALYIELGAHGPTPKSTASALTQLLTALDRSATHDAAVGDVAALTAALRTVARGRRLLLVLDDAKDAEQVTALLPGGGDHVVLVTSRSVLVELETTVVVGLTEMLPDDAKLLLRSFLDVERLRAGEAHISELAELCGQLPLALRIVGARLMSRSSWPLAYMADRLRDERRRLGELRLGNLSVSAALATSYVELTESDALVLRTVGDLGASTVSAQIVCAALGDVEPEDVIDGLERLVDAQLLQAPQPGRYTCHDLVRIFAADAAQRDQPDDRRERLNRATAWFVGASHTANTALLHDQSTLDHTTAMAWFAAELNTALALAARCSMTINAPARVPIDLEATWSRYLDVRSDWPTWARLCDLAITAAIHTGDARAEASARHRLGVTLARRHYLAEADDSLWAALEHWHAVDDRPHAAETTHALGLVRHLAGSPTAAHELLSIALIEFTEVGNQPGRNKALMNLGLVSQLLGRWDEAEEHLREAVAGLHQAGDPVNEARAHHNLGELHRQRGRSTDAVHSYQQSLELCRHTGDEHTAALSEFGLAETAAARGDLAQAIKHAQLSAEVMRRLKIPEAQIVINQLAAWRE